MQPTTVLTATSLAAMVSAHGYFTSPTARQLGPAYQELCGMQAYYMMSGDINGNAQTLKQTTQNRPDYDPSQCHLWKCKGMRYSDNTHYSPSQTVPLPCHIQAPHTGYADVSIIDIGPTNGKVLAPNLRTWSDYAEVSKPLPSSQEVFSITIPEDLGTKCSKAGVCAIQMFWNAESINQTRESCVDIPVGAKAGGRRHAREWRSGVVEEMVGYEG